jgi:hypothetical protein
MLVCLHLLFKPLYVLNLTLRILKPLDLKLIVTDALFEAFHLGPLEEALIVEDLDD